MGWIERKRNDARRALGSEEIRWGSIFARMKKAHPVSGWAFRSVNDLVYLLDFFAFALIALAATFGFAAFVLIAIDSTPPSIG